MSSYFVVKISDWHYLTFLLSPSLSNFKYICSTLSNVKLQLHFSLLGKKAENVSELLDYNFQLRSFSELSCLIMRRFSFSFLH